MRKSMVILVNILVVSLISSAGIGCKSLFVLSLLSVPLLLWWLRFAWLLLSIATNSLKFADRLSVDCDDEDVAGPCCCSN